MARTEEQLIVVDEADQVIAPRSKIECHAGRGLLHRAFSVYLFDSGGRLLIQKRNAHKPLWPLYWSNSCCSHPFWGEEVGQAAHRRVREELGLEAPLRLVSKFHYHALFEPVGAEREICSVYVGVSDAEVRANPREIAEWRFVDCDQLDDELSNNPGAYTPWFRIGWRALRSEHWAEVEAMQRAARVRA